MTPGQVPVSNGGGGGGVSDGSTGGGERRSRPVVPRSAEALTEQDGLESSWLGRHGSVEPARTAAQSRSFLRDAREAEFSPRDEEMRVWVFRAGDAWVKAYQRQDGRFFDVRGRPIQDADALVEPHHFHEDDLRDYTDAVDLVNLHEAPILDLLRRRFNDEAIYTFVGGDVLLIAVNPCASIAGLYSKNKMNEVADGGGRLQGGRSYTPHIFSIADASFRDMMREKKCQSIIISGDSGAGKTESCKLILRHLAYINVTCQRKASLKPVSSIEAKIIQSNPVLEAFGNAKTMLNLNSSRFGKLINVNYDFRGLIVGAHVRQFLLEKSRVVSRGSGERSFHIFYQLCAGASEELRKELHLLRASEYEYLSRSTCIAVTSVDDAADFQGTMAAMDRIGFGMDEQRHILNLVSAVLRIGNIRFRPSLEDENVACVDNTDELKVVSQLLKVNEEALISCLTGNMKKINGELFRKDYTVEEAATMRDSLAKDLYKRIFGCIVDRLNVLLAQGGEVQMDNSDDEVRSEDLPEELDENLEKLAREDASSSSLSIGILDMSGFEIFETNSLEQLLINYSNEKLQGQFHERLSEVEKAVYEEEGVMREVHYDPFENLMRVQALEQGPFGVLPLLDQECLLGRSVSSTSNQSGSNFLRNVFEITSEKFSNSHGKDVSIVEKHKFPVPEFIFHHYAGPVSYRVDHLAEKNKDALHVSLGLLMASSEDSLLQFLYFDVEEEDVTTDMSNKGSRSVGAYSSGALAKKLESNPFLSRSFAALSPLTQKASPNMPKSSSSLKSRVLIQKRTVWSEFHPQLEELVATLRETTPRYVRCIKPNMELTPFLLESTSVLHQLKCSGVLEYIRVRRQGLPVRLGYDHLLDRFQVLAASLSVSSADYHDWVEAVLERERSMVLGVSDSADRTYDWALGRTRVFLSDSLYKLLERRRLQTIIDSANIIQAVMLASKLRVAHRLLISNMVTLQRTQRRRHSMLDLQRTRSGVELLCKFRRGNIVRRHRSKVSYSAQAVQTTVRGLRYRRDFLDIRASSIFIQRFWRRMHSCAAMNRVRRSTRTVERVYRMHVVRDAASDKLKETRSQGKALSLIANGMMAKSHRKSYRWLRLQLLRSSSVALGHLVRSKYSKYQHGACLLQSAVRARHSRRLRSTNEVTASSRILQALIRTRIQILEKRKRSGDIETIQMSTRARHTRLHREQIVASAAKLEMVSLRLLTRLRHQRRSAAVELVESKARQLIARREFAMSSKACVVIQSVLRCIGAGRAKEHRRRVSPARYSSGSVIVVLGGTNVGKSSVVNTLVGRPVREVKNSTVDDFDFSDLDLEIEGENEEVVSVTVGPVSLFDVGSISDHASASRMKRRLGYPELHLRSVFVFVDRLDSHRLPRESLRAVTACFGPAIWSRSIIVLTHGDQELSKSTISANELFARKVKAINAAIGAIVADISDSTSMISPPSVSVHLLSCKDIDVQGKWADALSLAHDDLSALSTRRLQEVEAAQDIIHAATMRRMSILEIHRQLSQLLLIECTLRSTLCSKQFRSIRDSSAILQRAARTWTNRSLVLVRRYASSILAKVFLRHLSHYRFFLIRRKTICLQNAMRAISCRRRRDLMLKSWPMRFARSGRRCGVVVIGPPGTGKSSLINLIYGERRREVVDSFAIDPQYEDLDGDYVVPVTSQKEELRLYDTLGFLDRLKAEKIAAFLKNPTRYPLSSFVFVDRLDSHRLPRETLRVASDIFGNSMWARCSFVFTHSDNVQRDSVNLQSVLSAKKKALVSILRDGSSESSDSSSQSETSSLLRMFIVNNHVARSDDQNLSSLCGLMDAFDEDAQIIPHEFAFQNRMEGSPRASFSFPAAVKLTSSRRPSNWDILGVARGSDAAEVRRAYRFLARKYHPDRNPEDVESALVVFRQIADAYEALSAVGVSDSPEHSSAHVPAAPTATLSFPCILRSTHRRCWSAKRNVLLANCKEHEVGPAERFTVRSTGNGYFLIRAYNGSTVCLDDMGQLVLQDVETAFATRFGNNPLPANMFRLDFGNDGTITIFAANDRYAVAERSGLIIAKSEKPRNWETFSWKFFPSPTGEELYKSPVVMLISGHNSRFIEMDPTTNALSCQCCSFVMAERFTLEQHDANRFRFRCGNGRLLGCREGQYALIAIEEEDASLMNDVSVEFYAEFRDNARCLLSVEGLKEKRTLNVESDGSLVFLNRRRRHAELIVTLVFEDDQIVRKLEFDEPEILRWETSDVSTLDDVDLDGGVGNVDATPRIYQVQAFGRF
uniref:Calmodulin n=1 Tax=Compsopogon caeruleus TaxID=31354 RepID=A0A6T6BUX0_9RHOD|mmetsp:Transcript_18166/g.37851  ORF Transcript_18166/g.37851 Transcript_18166/m.37851 type:complete len:2267 (+) Transcript_18166:183-6983(+)|eukprot:CAMPEP_0184684016 /NCGR_PEP_ID=MMETSP0312-20130426/13511_1 /TAXON_ID=31354 /ORGANISM="Compsopogon coeruleus, Strain SAG 36.94" /LENGTH=2266 /DNA_ID=CAMNT_0027136803 /DNA_START=99 /DNA_END=6899 /DNA_ORIENTATION=-